MFIVQFIWYRGLFFHHRLRTYLEHVKIVTGLHGFVLKKLLKLYKTNPDYKRYINLQQQFDWSRSLFYSISQIWRSSINIFPLFHLWHDLEIYVRTLKKRVITYHYIWVSEDSQNTLQDSHLNDCHKRHFSHIYHIHYYSHCRSSPNDTL